MSTPIYDVILLSGATGLLPGVGDDWTVADGELVSVAEPVVTTQADPSFLGIGDTLTIGGTVYNLTAMTGHAVDVTYSTGAGPTVLLTKMAVMELTDPVGGGTIHIAIFPDAFGDLTNIESVQFVDVDLDPATGPFGASGFQIEDIDSDNAVTLVSATGPDGTVHGTDSNNTMLVGYVDAEGDEITHAGNIIDAGEGDDTVVAGNGDDTIHGGLGNDNLRGDGGDDVVNGDAGNDTITLITGDGSDTVSGGDDSDTIYVHGGDAHVIDGGAGGVDSDTLAVYSGTTGVNITFTGNEAGTATLGTTTATFTEIEIIATGSGNDTINASASGEAVAINSGAGNDLVTGSSADDDIFAGLGADTVEGGAGNDKINLAGNPMEIDHLVFSDGHGNDTVAGFEMPLASGPGWIGLDQLDVAGLTNASGDPVTTDDVTVSDDGSGNAVLTFPNGESITLSGVAPATISGPDVLVAMGIPAAPTPDGTVNGTGAGESMTLGYTDADGDQITAGNDVIDAGAGADTVNGGAGDDLVQGGAGQDNLSISAGGGNDTLMGGDDSDWIAVNGGGAVVVQGGEGGATDADMLHVFDGATNVSITFTGNEAGTASMGGTTVTFSEIEAAHTEAGNDTIDASASGANLSLYGGAGNDLITGGSGADVITTGTGDDTVTGGQGNDSLILGDDGDNDVIVMSDGHGNDTLTGFDMPIDNGDGTYTPVDTFDLSGMTNASGDPVTGADITVGNDGSGNAVLSFPNGESITLIGVAPGAITPAVLEAMGVPAAPGGIPDGVVDGTVSGDTMGVGYTDAQGDVIDHTGNEIKSGDGNDTVIAGSGDDWIYGGDGDDWIEGGSGNDTLYGDAGNDTIFGGGGNNQIDGGQGNDNIMSGSGTNMVNAGDGNDIVALQGASDTVYGGAGNDGFGIAVGDNEVYGETGNDTFTVYNTAVSSVIDGGTDVGEGDVDALNFQASGGPGVTVTYSGNESGTFSFAGGGSGAFSEIEVLSGSNSDDYIDATATDGGIGVSAGDGNDTVIGGTGNDTITAHSGDDFITGGAGDDLIHLGNDGDNDVIVMSDGHGDDTLTGFDMPIDNGDGTFTPVDILDLSGLTDAGGDPVDGDDITVGDDGSGNAVLTFPNGESITLIGVAPGALTPDVLTAMGVPAGAGGTPDGIVDGTSAGEVMNAGYTDADGDVIDDTGNTIHAGGGADTVYAGLGDDTVLGNAGQDFLFGGNGDDMLQGGLDNDSIWGDAGQDTLYGNDGDDKLIGGAENDLLIGGAGDDTLYGDAVDGDLGGMAPGDTPEPGYGNDTLVLDGGNDIAFGGSGDDTFRIFDGFGNHQITGGETGEIEGDRIDGLAMSGDVLVTLSGPEAGTIDADPADPLSPEVEFTEIERLNLGSGDDTVIVQTAQTMTVNGSDGFDTLELPDAAPGDPAPVVTVTSEVPYPGIPGATTKTGYVDFPDGSRMYFENFEEIICFTPGTLIDTLRGRVAVEALVAGDKVLTRDHGFQPLAWTGRRDLTAAEIARCPAAAPIRIAAGALGKGLPERDLLVSPRHRMLITGARAELMFGEREVLVAAADLLGLPGVTQEAAGAVSYVHVMCDAHQIIRAEGAWSESFQPAEGVLNALDRATRDELLALFPELGTKAGLAAFASARPVLTASEVRALIAA